MRTAQPMSAIVNCTLCGASFEIPRKKNAVRCIGCKKEIVLFPMSARPKRPDRRERVIVAARNLTMCVVREREIRERIDWHACERFDETEFDERSEITYLGHEPCCFTKDESDEDNGMLRREEWCSICETNWTLRGEVGVERKRRAGLLRGLVNAVLAEIAP